MGAKKRAGDVRNLSGLARSVLQDVRADFSTKGLASSALAEPYVGVDINSLQKKYCKVSGFTQVDFDLALKDLEDVLFVGTGPILPFRNEPGGALVFINSTFSKREYVYLTEAGYRAAAQMTNQKPRSTPRPNGVISGGTFHQSQIGIGERVTQTQRVDVVENDVSHALLALTEAITNEHSLPSPDKETMLDQIAYLNEQAMHPPKDRKPGVIKATLGAVSQIASTVSTVAAAWQTTEPLLKQYFGFP